MNNEYILKHIEKDRPFKTEKECIEYYMDECWVKQDVASDLFYYKVIIDKAIEYITNGSDFKSIYFKKTDEELWKILLEDNIKNNLLDILRGNE